MERITISVDDDLLAQFDRLMESRGYRNRSEAFRDLLRQQLNADRLETGDARHCIACLSYVFDHHQRELARRLTQIQHDHHDVGLSTLHVHLDHDTCMETAILHGPVDVVRAFAEGVIAEPGVRHGNLHLIPVDVVVETHSEHHHHHGAEAHAHARPKA